MFNSSVIRRTPLVFKRSLSIINARPALKTAPATLTWPPLAPLRGSTLAAQLIVRGAASSVSGRPGSQTFKEAAQNIREEVGNSTTDFAKVIAGANWFQDATLSDPKRNTFLGITNAVAHSVPTPYIATGLAGGLPYVGTALATIYMAQQAGMAMMDATSSIDPGVAITMLDQALNIQMTYGAVMLSFLGALHWGFEFAGYGGTKGYPRLLLGAAPVVLGWSTLAMEPMTALIMQWIGFTGMWWADWKATSAGWTPMWYSQYRFYLSILTGTCIIGTLAATSYWGPVGGHGLVSHDLNMIRGLREKKQIESQGVINGDVEAVLAPEDSGSYVLVRKKHAQPMGEVQGAGQ
ncbi:uncharacterized protein LAESUDRAFT_665271 [Laetiporus sulphureus 93-53]|uniref:Mnn4-regulates the mannosylphosphorylation n=1 Tax=Laetiporus sulphureus 93-53 TaxID=1314785 RepID=A0A165BD40_9APHY|nr:uncharacterized protein LAESUDRAFT_665271 [Laetiporus sulphureus 93-53]KZT00779.1 hypothetical protein LAESUDRAFT_665271 [Laetiporus sulphureus 93-53]